MNTPEEILGTSHAPCTDEVRRAYRALARRWHPDRFAPGPERDWASERMCEINAAYKALIADARGREGSQGETLETARRLISGGSFDEARRLMMSMPTRTAEWNYLFGSLLTGLHEFKKALIYFTVAAHQQPNSEKYAGAVRQAQLRAARAPRLFRR